MKLGDAKLQVDEQSSFTKRVTRSSLGQVSFLQIRAL